MSFFQLSLEQSHPRAPMVFLPVRSPDRDCLPPPPANSIFVRRRRAVPRFAKWHTCLHHRRPFPLNATDVPLSSGRLRSLDAISVPPRTWSHGVLSGALTHPSGTHPLAGLPSSPLYILRCFLVVRRPGGDRLSMIAPHAHFSRSLMYSGSLTLGSVVGHLFLCVRKEAVPLLERQPSLLRRSSGDIKGRACSLRARAGRSYHACSSNPTPPRHCLDPSAAHVTADCKAGAQDV